MRYKASLDGTAKAITHCITVVFVLIIAGQPMIDAFRSTSVYIAILLIGIYLITFACSPRAYSVNEREVVIHRPLTSHSIPRSQIASVEKLNEKQLGFLIRTFGVGGLFGYFGKFWSRELGNISFYATNLKNMVLIRLKDDEQLVVTPDNVDHFLAEVHSTNQSD
jgi:hypothetical protein